MFVLKFLLEEILEINSGSDGDGIMTKENLRVIRIKWGQKETLL